jgi:hypothetical protein
MSTTADRLQSFATALLESSGAAVDWPAGTDEGLALLPDACAQAFDCPETVRLRTGVDAQADVLSVHLASDFLEQAGTVLDDIPRVAEFRLRDLYVKRSSMEEPVARAFAFPNARTRVLGARESQAQYHVWTFLASLQSDDRWEQLVTVALNARSLARVELPELLLWTDAEPANLPPAPETLQTAAHIAGSLLPQRAGAFLKRMAQRCERDRARLREYYGALSREALARLRRTRKKAAEIEARYADQRRAINLELRRKLAETEQRFAPTAKLEPLTLARFCMPCLSVELHVQRKRATRTLLLHWNALAKEMEPTSCASCGRSIYRVYFSDDDACALCPVCARGGAHGT